MPWYLRSGKCLPEMTAEVVVEMQPLPAALFGDSQPAAGVADYLRPSHNFLNATSSMLE